MRFPPQQRASSYARIRPPTPTKELADAAAKRAVFSGHVRTVGDKVCGDNVVALIAGVEIQMKRDCWSVVRQIHRRHECSGEAYMCELFPGNVHS